MSKWLLSIAVAVLAFASLPAYPQAMPQIEQRVADARDRVHRGSRNGSLTRGETDRLHGELDAVERLMRRVRGDGQATPRERQEIRDELARVEREIDRLSQNSARRRN